MKMKRFIFGNEEREVEGNGLKLGVSANHRNDGHGMQDHNSILIGLAKNGLENWSFMAVFDGHQTDHVSKYLSKELINNILNADKKLFDELAQNKIDQNQETQERIKLAIKKSFFNTEENHKDGQEFDPDALYSGSTAVACLISPTHVYIMNCGDSRAILVSDNQIKIVTLDHKPNNPLEKERIENAGGRIWVKENRICGKKDINLSRSFGDYQFKVNFDLDPFKQIISAEPDIYIHERSSQDEFIVLASDGIWDVISNEEIQQYINYRLKITQNLAEICKDVINVCIKKVQSCIFIFDNLYNYIFFI